MAPLFGGSHGSFSDCIKHFKAVLESQKPLSVADVLGNKPHELLMWACAWLCVCGDKGLCVLFHFTELIYIFYDHFSAI